MSESRARVRRKPDRARYEREQIDAILDEGLVAHVGFVDASGRPVVIPLAYGRDGDRVYLHGSHLSRLLATASAGVDLCLTVTLLDALVLARSTFHSSMNYRSVVLFGRGIAIEDPGEKIRALDCIVEHLIPGRGAEARPGSAQELVVTTVVGIDIDEASAKIRTGPPQDLESDTALPIWGGLIPVEQRYGSPVADAFVREGIAVPRYVTQYHRPAVRRA